MAKAKKKKLSLDELLEEALVKEEDKPYEVPGNWVWTKLDNIVSICTGKQDANYGTENGKYYFFTCAAEPIRCDGYSFEGESILLAGNGANVGLALYYNGKFEAYQRTYVIQAIGHLEKERYNPSLKLAMDIAKVFGKSVEEVFEFAEDDKDD